MNSHELEQARSLQKHKENMKDPAYATAYAEAQRRKKEREKSEEILNNFATNGFYRPALSDDESKEKTAAEMRHEEIVKLFS